MTDNVRIDGIVWRIWVDNKNIRQVQPLCPIHSLRLRPVPYTSAYKWGESARTLKCEDCDDLHKIPRIYSSEKIYVIDRVDAKVFKGMKVLNLDDEAMPIAKEKAVSKNGKYFITTQLMESKRGIQAVIYAGEKGSSKKTQIFVEPEVKRLAFDQKDLNPSDVFLKVTATFADGTSHSMEQAESSTES